MKKIYILLVAIFAISSTSCSDYLDSDYIFEDRETIDKVFTDYKKTEQWLAQAYTYLLGQCCDVASKRNESGVTNEPFCSMCSPNTSRKAASSKWVAE